jgi:hypothetical protein
VIAVGDRDSYNQQVIAEFRAQQGVVGGALAGSSMLLLHHVGVKSGVALQPAVTLVR